MQCFDRDYGYALYLKYSIRYCVQIYLRDTGIFKLVKYVSKLALQGCLYPFGGIDVYSCLLPEVEGTDIVHPGNVVLMLVGENDGIQTFYMLTQHLVPE